jgi:hypothetical protein
MTMHEVALRLPEGFEELERFVARWSGADTDARVAAREESSMEDIRDFYEAMLERAGDAIKLIDRYPLHDLPADVGVLCRLLLSLAHAGSAIEVLGTPRVPMAPFPTGVRVSSGSHPYG